LVSCRCGVLASWKTGHPTFMSQVDVGAYYLGLMQVRRVGLMQVWRPCIFDSWTSNVQGAGLTLPHTGLFSFPPASHAALSAFIHLGLMQARRVGFMYTARCRCGVSVPGILYRTMRLNTEWPLLYHGRWACFPIQAFFHPFERAEREPFGFRLYILPNFLRSIHQPDHLFTHHFPPPAIHHEVLSHRPYRCSCSCHQCLCRAQRGGCQGWRHANSRDLLSREQLF
jgi:hypothetical protein